MSASWCSSGWNSYSGAKMELVVELTEELANELARERDLQKDLLSTLQTREKAWKWVMNAVRDAVYEIRELTFQSLQRDSESTSPLVRCRKEEVRREAINIVRDAVDMALGVVFVDPKDGNGVRTGLIPKLRRQHQCDRVRGLMLRSADSLSKMLSPSELDIWLSTTAQTIKIMLFDMWYVH
jgi:hypothetical protein